jgi:carbonic anhydrase
MKKIITTLTALTALSASCFVSASEWSYSGKTAPEH